MGENKFVLALYDFASKQEYIYRTSKVKEISGASKLLGGMYRELLGVAAKENCRIKYCLPEVRAEDDAEYKDEAPFDFDAFASDADHIGEVLYDGGGNLMVLFKSREKYVEANRIMSAYLLKNVPGLHMICACADVVFENGKADFKLSVKNLYEENAGRKNRRPAIDMSEVIPMTQIDPMTFLPVIEKRTENNVELSLSADRKAKRDAYSLYDIPDEPEGLTAVVYIDGNSMGQRVKAITDSAKTFEEGVNGLRKFSWGVNRDFLVRPELAIKNYLKNKDGSKAAFRRIVGAGDEITFICDAENALQLVFRYFEELERSNEGKAPEDHNYSCAGISIIHAKSPFNTAYEIAEAACESAKELSRRENGNYLDFYYCHSGITNDFETLRKLEQDEKTARPYKLSDLSGFSFSLAPKLLVAGRGNVKALGEAAQKSSSAFNFEIERVNAYILDKCRKFAEHPDRVDAVEIFELLGIDNIDGLSVEAREGALKNKLLLTTNDNMNVIYDFYEFFDLWFSDSRKINALKGVK